MTNQIDLDELRRLLAAAPMRPWRAVQGGAWTRLVSDSGLDIAFLGFDVPAVTRRHAAVIAAAVNALPQLLAVVDAARAVQAAELVGRAAGKARDDDGIIAALAAKDQAEERLYAALDALDGGPTP